MLQGAGIKHVLNPDPYRGRFGNDGAAYADDVRDVIATVTSGTVAGFCAETFQGVGGTVPLADGYLPAVYKVEFLRQTPLNAGLCACLVWMWAPLCLRKTGTCQQSTRWRASMCRLLTARLQPLWECRTSSSACPRQPPEAQAF